MHAACIQAQLTKQCHCRAMQAAGAGALAAAFYNELAAEAYGFRRGSGGSGGGQAGGSGSDDNGDARAERLVELYTEVHQWVCAHATTAVLQAWGRALRLLREGEGLEAMRHPLLACDDVSEAQVAAAWLQHDRGLRDCCCSAICQQCVACMCGPGHAPAPVRVSFGSCGSV